MKSVVVVVLFVTITFLLQIPSSDAILGREDCEAAGTATCRNGMGYLIARTIGGVCFTQCTVFPALNTGGQPLVCGVCTDDGGGNNTPSPTIADNSPTPAPTDVCDAEELKCTTTSPGNQEGILVYRINGRTGECIERCVQFPAVWVRYTCGTCPTPAPITSTPTTPPGTRAPTTLGPTTLTPTAAPSEPTTRTPTTLPPSPSPTTTAPTTATKTPNVTPTSTPTSLTIAPTSAPAGSDFITLDLTSITAADRPILERAAARWNQIITSTFPDYSGPRFPVPSESSCTWPATVVGLYVCVYYGNAQGADARGGFDLLIDRNKNGKRFPVLGRVVLESSRLTALRNDPGFYEKLMMHELGHAIGIGLVEPWRDTSNSNVLDEIGKCPYKGAVANAKFNQLKGCNGNAVIPTDNACGHWTNECMDAELMAPFLNANARLSEMTIAAVEDIGYSVNYGPADSWTAEDFGAGCGCRRRRSLRQNLQHEEGEDYNNNNSTLIDYFGVGLKERDQK